MPRLEKDDNVFSVHEELPDEFIISVDGTFSYERLRLINLPALTTSLRGC